ncbi:ABC transporter substrate-binding protein [Oceanobacillus picturae]|uniref:ABC transporter substrate-binding protein n=1 Tax=Oceanobacillus picturae TaxID=171693 RepID=A0A0U9HB21_9BACI|nr:hypothetical protein [Oceanobacillus picturae]GAQ19902.1 ABC transporter substrate-binding protein [Oceanobacillus picturae]
MKKIFSLTIVILLAIMLGACNSEEETSDETNEESNSTVNDENNEGDTTSGTEESEGDDEGSSDEEDSSNGKSFQPSSEDQLDLGVGDTGSFDTTLGTYDITLNSAEIIEEELDGEASQLDNLMLLDITIKNTSESSQMVEDLIEDLEITHNLEGTGSSNAAEYFSSVEELSGEIASGEEVNGQFITDISEEEEYYFRKKVGNIAAETSNQVVWTIPAEEAK